jgi:uncharacterized protein (TIGR03435 family)
MKPVAGTVLLIFAAALVYGQSPQPVPPVQREFDAVSVKPYVPPGSISEACNPRGDPVMLTRTGCTLEQLVEQAYDLKPYQVHLKGPSWADSDRYVIQARLASPATQPEMMRMLQPVLATRFHLIVHWENGQAPVYFLEVASHRPKLSPATDTKKCGQVFVREGIFKADCVTIDDIADVLEKFVAKDRPVVNRTGLTKDRQYQIDLEFSQGDDPSAAPSIFSALPDQLGLTLKAGRAYFVFFPPYAGVTSLPEGSFETSQPPPSA